jgi:hypothetical protein
MHEARLREVERRRLTVDHGRCLIRLRRAVQHAAPDRLEVEGRLEVPRLDQLEHPRECRLGRAAQRSARGGDQLRGVHKVGLGTQTALLLGVLGQIVHLLPIDCG